MRERERVSEKGSEGDGRKDEKCNNLRKRGSEWFPRSNDSIIHHRLPWTDSLPPSSCLSNFFPFPSLLIFSYFVCRYKRYSSLHLLFTSIHFCIFFHIHFYIFFHIHFCIFIQTVASHFLMTSLLITFLPFPFHLSFSGSLFLVPSPSSFSSLILFLTHPFSHPFLHFSFSLGKISIMIISLYHYLLVFIIRSSSASYPFFSVF